MKTFLRTWVKNERGATAIEYGMIVIGIAIAISALVFTMGDQLVVIFQKAIDKIMSVL